MGGGAHRDARADASRAHHGRSAASGADRAAQIRAEVVREGRKIQLCAVTLLHEDVVVVRATVLKIRRAELELPPTAVEEEDHAARTGSRARLADIPNENPNAFIRGLTLRVVQGNFARPARRRSGFAPTGRCSQVEAPTPLQRAAMIADFCNGVSTVLELRSWTFINGDLTISLARLPVGDWILLDAQSWLGDHGAGIAFAKLGDSRGYFGRAIQSLVIEPRAVGRASARLSFFSSSLFLPAAPCESSARSSETRTPGRR